MTEWEGYIYMSERNCQYLLSVFLQRKKMLEIFVLSLDMSPMFVFIDMFFHKIWGNGG